MSERRKAPPVRPRYGRIAMAATSTAVTALAVLGGAGALPSAARAPGGTPSVTPAAADLARSATRDGASESRSPEDRSPGDRSPEDRAPTTTQVAPPAASGAGRRVVFSEGRQRVWLVGADNETRRTYLVSGSIYDNLDPGTYSVYSRSEQAYGIDDSGTMRYFVRFAQGDNAAIGFHDIPVDDGRPVQTAAELGTPLSHGCIRQRRADARAMWAFASLGTTVVVTA